MKKTALLSAFLGIFAGFWLFSADIISAQSLPNGTSESICHQTTVKLDVSAKGERIWRDCEKNDDGCQLRFCNKTPRTDSTGDYWKKEDCNKYCVGFQESIPIGKNTIKSITGESGTDLAMNYVSMIYKFGASILGIVAVLVIVVSGVQLMTGGVDEGAVSAAKNRILQALLSLAILFSSALILRTVNPDFFT